MNTKTLLIVDDDDGLRDSLEDILRDEGYLLYSAPNCTQAMQIAKEKEPAAALLDLKLPDGSGTDLLARFKKTIPDCLCIVMTAFADLDSALFAIEQGAFQYLQKPVRPTDLLNCLDRMFETIRLREKKQHAEQKLRQSERTIRSLLDALPAAAFLLDTQNHILASNRVFAESLGKEVDEIFGIKVAKLKAGELLEKTRHKAIEAVALKKPLRYTMKVEGKYFDTIISPVLDDKGDVSRLAVFSSDITKGKLAELEKERLQVQLAQSQKMEAIGTLAGGVAHDFNNILGAIIGYSELALIDAKKGSSQYQNLQEVLRAGVRAKDLVKQILAFSRQADQERRPVKAKTIVEEAVKFVRASLPTTIEIRQDIQSDSLVMADPTQIHQVLMNLCTNAEHAMREKGGVMGVTLVDVKLRRDFTADYPELKPGMYLELAVSDTGHGIPSHTLDRIFDPFFTTKEPGEGTGMGLSAVHGIVRSYGGAIAASSELGKGSTFRVYLPVIDRLSESQASADDPIPTGTERILFVDDEPALVNIGKQALKSLGYQVTIRTDSLEALELFKANPHRFDLVITDMSMPNMSGDILSAELMKVRPEIPVILCTGYSSNISKQTAMGIGIKAFVHKPADRVYLAKLIREILDESRTSE